MKHLLSSISLLLFIIFSAADVHAQQVFKLNSIDSRSKQMTAKTISGANQQRQYYTLNDEEVNFLNVDEGDYIEMESTPGSISTFKVNRVENYTSTTLSFLTQDINNPENTFTFTYSNGQLHGIYHKSHKEVYFFEYDNSTGQNYVAQSSSFYDDKQFCSIHEVNHDISAFASDKLKGKSKGADIAQSHLPTTASMTSSLDDEITIDLMLLYTAKAKAWAESTDFNTIDAVIAAAMANSQTALDNSQTGIKLRLVHYYQTDYNDDSSERLSSGESDYVSAGDHLRRLTRNPDNRFNLCPSSTCSETDYDGYMEEAHQLREQYGADVVASIMSEPNTGGIAWVNFSTAGSSSLAFSVNRVQQIASNYTLVHEFGHNIGNVHSRNQTSAQADEFGGLFVYSTGNLFATPEGNYATIMAYNDVIFTTVPYFSSSEVELSGTPTGNPVNTTNEGGPADNARSMREIKRVIASYRSTIVDPPVTNIDVSTISADLNQENSTATVPVTITNNGASDLMWDFDFDIERSGISASKQLSAKTIDSAPLINSYSSGSTAEFMQSDGPGVIFSTSFETSEGFSLGDFAADIGWRAFSTLAPFQISDVNSSEGSQHLRLPRRTESSGSMFSRSPFFGPQPMGEFVISFDIATQDQAVNGSGEVFDVYIFDGSNEAISSGIIIQDENIFARSVDEFGEGTFSFTGNVLPSDGTYRTMEIRYNPNNQSVDYFLDGTPIASNPYTSGRKPDYMYFGQRNDVSGAYMDIDNISVERLHSPFDWLTTESFGGVVAPGESQTVNLTLNATDVETGSYETILLVRSNDPANPVIEVPVSANIEMATSSEITSEVPQRLELAQNYPNPFNPTTTIQFSLNRSSDVTLEVFNITGQRVATLINGSMSAGSHQHTFDASSLSSGIYMYRLITPEQMLTRQMILIK